MKSDNDVRKVVVGFSVKPNEKQIIMFEKMIKMSKNRFTLETSYEKLMELFNESFESIYRFVNDILFSATFSGKVKDTYSSFSYKECEIRGNKIILSFFNDWNKENELITKKILTEISIGNYKIEYYVDMQIGVCKKKGNIYRRDILR